MSVMSQFLLSIGYLKLFFSVLCSRVISSNTRWFVKIYDVYVCLCCCCLMFSICIHSPIFRINSSSYYVTSGYELGLVWMKGHKHIHTSYVTSYMTIFRKKNLHFPPSYILIKKLWMRLHSFICNHASFNMTMNLQFIEKARQKRLRMLFWGCVASSKELDSKHYPSL